MGDPKHFIWQYLAKFLMLPRVSNIMAQVMVTMDLRDGIKDTFVSDGSKAFVAGGFTEKELTPDCSELEPEQSLGVWEWLEFYRKEDKYPALGKLIGFYYDENGDPTPNRDQFMSLVDR